MMIRFPRLLALALGVGLPGGAPRVAAASAAAPLATVARARQAGPQVERPREDDNTRRAQRALEQADSAADEAAARGWFEQALAAARASLASDRNNPLAHYQAGVAALGLRRYGDAARHLERAGQLWPIYDLETVGIREHAWAGLYQEAVPLVNAGRYREAIPLLERADTIYDHRPEVMIVLGRIYAQLGEHSKALQQLDHATEVIRSERMQEVDAATAAKWQEQARAIPLLKATLLSAVGRFEESVSLLRDLLAQNPDDVTIARNLGTILIQIGEHEEAFRIFDTLMARPGLSSQDYYNIGVGYYQGEATSRATHAFREAATRSMRDRDALAMWARSLQLDSAWYEIPPVAERWLELDPHNEQAHVVLAEALNQIGGRDRAREVMTHIERIEVQVGSLHITRVAAGGAVVTGRVINQLLEPGTAVTLTFTFYDGQGHTVGTGEYRLSAGQRGAGEPFRVAFDSDQMVAGYGYRITIG